MSYKIVPQKSTVSAVADAVAELVALGEECRSVVDSASENLQQSDRFQTLDGTAGELESLQEPDVSEDFGEIAITYQESQNLDKRRSPSRAVRRDNACAILHAAADALDEFAEKLVQQQGEHKPEGSDSNPDDATALAQELRDMAETAEGCEFPGMYG